MGLLHTVADDTVWAGRTVRADGSAEGHRAPACRGAGGSPATRPRRRRPLAARACTGRVGRPGQRPAVGRRRRRAAEAARDHRRERAALPPRGHIADLRGRAGTACRPSRYGAGRHPPADDRRFRARRSCWHTAIRPHSRPCCPRAKFTDRTLAEVRKRGWAQSVAEREPGVASVSAPVRDGRGTVIAAVSVSGPIDRMGRRPGARWAADLLAAAEALTRRL